FRPAARLASLSAYNRASALSAVGTGALARASQSELHTSSGAQPGGIVPARTSTPRRHAIRLADSEAVEHEDFMASCCECGHERGIPVVERSTKAMEEDESPIGADRPRGDAHAVDDHDGGFSFWLR